jgi:hypothetical protein
MVWKVTVDDPTRRRSRNKTRSGADCGHDPGTGACREPATIKVIDDNGVHRRTLCSLHADEFIDSLRHRR